MNLSKRTLWLFQSYCDQNDIKAVTRVLKRGILWSKGPEIKAFEKKLADFIGRTYAVSFNSGTSALHALLMASSVQGKEVIVPSHTFAATANAVVASGARPVFADIENVSLGLDPADVKKKLNKRTRAIMPIHFGGDVCGGIKELKKLADHHGIILIEDAAHSLGARLGAQRVGTFGEAAMLSFCFNKVLTTGEGGMIVTDSRAIDKRLRLIRSHGHNEKGRQIAYGLNLRMSSMAAALGLSQFEKLEFIIKKRRQMAVYLDRKLAALAEVKVHRPAQDHYCVYQLYNIQVENKRIQKELRQYLKEHGIPTRVTYNPLHLTPYYKKSLSCKAGDLPVTENISRRIITLPFYPGLGRADLDYVAGHVKAFFGK